MCRVEYEVCTDAPIDLLCFCVNAAPTSEIYTLSLHDALPICAASAAISSPWKRRVQTPATVPAAYPPSPFATSQDRKSTRLNSSHTVTSYAVFCLKKKKDRFPPFHFNAFAEGPFVIGGF